jgi:hypothetical protein
MYGKYLNYENFHLLSAVEIRKIKSDTVKLKHGMKSYFILNPKRIAYSSLAFAFTVREICSTSTCLLGYVFSHVYVLAAHQKIFLACVK